jgi:hypothetical protein
MASEIHRRRTGRGLKVSEEIVVKEEMYEEDEDDLPRQYKYLAAHLHTNSPDMNHRVNAYITTQAAMATMARYQEVNRLFSESFPTAMAMQQQLNQSAYLTPLMNMANAGAMPSPIPSPAQTPRQQHTGTPNAEAQTLASPTPKPTTKASPSPLSPTPASANAKLEPKDLPYQAPTSMSSFQIDPRLAQSTSTFTSELPNEVKMMANIDPTDSMFMPFYGGNPAAWSMYGQVNNDLEKVVNASESLDDTTIDVTSPTELLSADDEFLFSPVDGNFDSFDAPLHSYGRVDTPGPGDAWESFVDFGTEQ